MKITNIINPSTEIEPKELSYELKKLITEYINDVRTKSVNYNLYLHSKPILVKNFLNSLGYIHTKFYNQEGYYIIFSFVNQQNKEMYVGLDLAIDYLNNKCYLLNSSPHRFGE